MSKTVDVARINDRELLSLFDKICRLIGASEFRVQELGMHANTAIALGKWDQHPLASSENHFVLLATAGKSTYSIRLERRLDDAKNFGFDSLTIASTQQGQNQEAGPSPEQIREVNRLVAATFQPQAGEIAKLLPSSETFSKLMSSHQSMIVELQRTVTAVGEQVSAARLRLEEEYAERATKLKQEIAELRQASEQDLQNARDELAAKEAALQQRSDAVDNRDHMFVRRELREKITNEIAGRLQGQIVGKTTSQIGWVVFILGLIGSAGLAVMAYFTLAEYAELVAVANKAAGSPVGSSQDVASASRVYSIEAWTLLARGFLAGFGSVGFLVYSIAWLKNVYHDRLIAQRYLERYSIDLNRASWAVETIMEAKRDGGTLPDILVAGVSKNLFDDNRPHLSEGGDALSSLLRASTKAKIGPSGAEFEISGRGAKRLADQIE